MRNKIISKLFQLGLLQLMNILLFSNMSNVAEIVLKKFSG